MKRIQGLLFLFSYILLVGCSPKVVITPQDPPPTSLPPTIMPSPTKTVISTTQSPTMPPVIAQATDVIFTYPELRLLEVQVGTSLVASPSHPNAYMPGDAITTNENVYLVGSDQDSAWLLVIDQHRLGWIPTFHSSMIGTLNLTKINEARVESCTGYLGALLSLKDVWETNQISVVIVQGFLYRSPDQASYGKVDLSLQIEETGQEHMLSIDSTLMETGGEIVSFTAVLEGLEPGYHIKFQQDGGSENNTPFTASFFNGNCSNIVAGSQNNQSENFLPTPLPTMTSRFVKITTYDSPSLIPAIDWSGCRSSFHSRLNIGLSAIVNTDPKLAQDLHDEPYNDAPVLGDLNPGEELSIVDGPSCSRGKVWWKVVAKQTGLAGWALEGDGSVYFLTPLGSSRSSTGTEFGSNSCEADYQSRLKAGDMAYVSFDPPLANRVRVKPGTNNEIIGRIEPGEEMKILEGPRCVNGWVWWKVRSTENGLIGWTAEGDSRAYWLIPMR